MAVSVDVLSTVVLDIEPEVSMALTKSTPFINKVKELKKVKYTTGQYGVQFPIEVSEHSNITQLSDGLEPLNLSVNDISRPAKYDHARYSAPVVISGKDRTNSGDDKGIIKLAEARYRSSLSKMYREINKEIMLGNTTLTDIGTLNGVIKTTFGFLEANAPGSQDSVVGGLSKATYATVPGWQNQYAASAATGAALISAMRDVQIGAGMNRPDGGDGREFHLLCLHPEAFRRVLDAQFSDNLRWVDTKEFDAGSFQLSWAGGVVCADPSLQTQYGGLGSNDIAGYLLNLDDITLAMDKDSDFKFTSFSDKVDQDAYVARIIFHGCLVAKGLGSSGLISIS